MRMARAGRATGSPLLVILVVLLVLAALPVLAARLVLATPASAHHIDKKDGPTSENVLPEMLRGVTVEQRLDHKVPSNLTFKDETGKQVELGSYFRSDRPVILTMNYFDCPQLCPLVLEGLTSTLNRIKMNVGKDVQVVTVSIDPRETPVDAAHAKQVYMDRYAGPGTPDGWHFLTGTETSIQGLAQAIGFKYRFVPQIDGYSHPSAIAVLTGTGNIARYFFGIDFSPRDLRLGLVEASNGKIGSIVDHAMLFCFVYDPNSGKYGPMALNIVRLGGLLTLLLLGGFIFTMWRKDVRRSRRLTEGLG